MDGEMPEGADDGRRQMTPEEVMARLLDGQELALLDLRSEAEFALGHPLFATSFPVDEIEVSALQRVPCVAVPIVMYDDGHGLIATAAARLQPLGYANIYALQGDLFGWTSAGGELFTGVNVPSKAFGELVATTLETAMISPSDYQAALASSDVVTMDVRTVPEFQTATLDQSVSVLGGDLVERACAVVEDQSRLVVVHCAGRTRSIIAAQTLINAGMRNKVVALENGTIGWRLAGLPLVEGRVAESPTRTEPSSGELSQRMRHIAFRSGVSVLSHSQLEKLAARAHRTTYMFDVRAEWEYLSGRLRGFTSAPGAQLIQETDRYAPVRGATIVLHSFGDGRAWSAGSWLAQMGWPHVFVLEGSADSIEFGPNASAAVNRPDVPSISPDRVAELCRHGTVNIVDVGSSSNYLRSHIRGAKHRSRTTLEEECATAPNGCKYVITSADGAVAAFATAGVERIRPGIAVALDGGNLGWRRSGEPLTAGNPPGEVIVEDEHRRPYVGLDVSTDSMNAYLEWEFGLVEQLARDGTHRFAVLDGRADGDDHAGR